MADTKISALPSATTPLAGTEVLPVVQGGTTDKVSVANLTAGRDVAVKKLQPTDNIEIASGKGVDFTAAGGDVLTMYDEGTWTPAPNSGSFSSATGTYTKIGRVVILTFDVIVGTGGGSTVNAPFTAAITAASGIYTSGQGFGAGTTSPTAIIGATGATIYFRTVGDGVPFSGMTFTAGATLTGTIVFTV